MKVVLDIKPKDFKALLAHLLHQGHYQEEAAFLFARHEVIADEHRFSVADMVLLSGPDFVEQLPDYLELADNVRGRVIKRAHDLGTSLIEVHSHVASGKPAFSYSDIRGLKETVPNMWWRLKRRPYMAIVASSTGFDALAWIESPESPVPLDEIRVGKKVLGATFSALGEWR